MTNQIKTTTNFQETGVDDQHWSEIQQMFKHRDELKAAEESARRAAARKAAKEEKKYRKKKKIASTLSWISAFISGTATYLLAIAWLDKVVAVDDPRFFGWCLLAYIPIVMVYGLVGEYIELQIWDKD